MQPPTHPGSKAILLTLIGVLWIPLWNKEVTDGNHNQQKDETEQATNIYFFVDHYAYIAKKMAMYVFSH